ncbi:hypothetical protein EVAR_16460_1 [Eumeta japonica]|uniref:Uncharacterized protein n=1 Tax=Eumeta variegata TaxID=151549 RepID=A0A4C1UKN3_EUMVA|nr:hypothetical protein EVAR_16460_1 [Eumeta japonica]
MKVNHTVGDALARPASPLLSDDIAQLGLGEAKEYLEFFRFATRLQPAINRRTNERERQMSAEFGNLGGKDESRSGRPVTDKSDVILEEQSKIVILIESSGLMAAGARRKRGRRAGGDAIANQLRRPPSDLEQSYSLSEVPECPR